MVDASVALAWVLPGEDTKNALELLQDFEFTVCPVDPAGCLNLSTTHDLAVYDSAYLNIAVEQQVTLWTMNQALKKAAENLGVAVLP